MDLLRIFAETALDWLRQVAVDLSSRFAGELVGQRLRRRKRQKKKPSTRSKK
jgi:hypothetical protein